MTTAERLTAIANNVPLVYAAGVKAGRTPEEPKDVCFWDYDGTLLYNYTTEEAMALTELPPAPTPPKDFLEFQEWNWTLEQIKTYEPPIDVGAVYGVTDEYSRFVIEVPTDALTTTMNINPWAAFSVDWGDGTIVNYAAATSKTSYEHTYTEPGIYTVKVGRNGNRIDFIGAAGESFLGSGVEASKLLEAYLATNATPAGYAFADTSNLKWVTLSAGGRAGDHGVSAFNNASALLALIFPSGRNSTATSFAARTTGLKVFSAPPGLQNVAYTGLAYSGLERICLVACNELPSSGYAFRDSRLKKVIVPDNFTAVTTLSFYNTRSLTEVVIGENVSTIGAQAFNSCSALARVYLKPATPPTLANVNAFASIPANCIFYVPKGSLEAYTTATNWSSLTYDFREWEP